MTDVETLRQLLARVEGAAGADEVLDDDLWAAFGSQNDGSLYDYTASVDAALALVGRVMPGWFWSVEWCDRSGYGQGPLMAFAQIVPENEWRRLTLNKGGLAWANTPALALLAALLRAKIAETDNG